MAPLRRALCALSALGLGVFLAAGVSVGCTGSPDYDVFHSEPCGGDEPGATPCDDPPGVGADAGAPAPDPGGGGGNAASPDAAAPVDPSEDVASPPPPPPPPPKDTDAGPDGTPPDAGPPKCFHDKDCPGRLCNRATRTCSTPGIVGSACRRNVECIKGTWCDPGTHRCAIAPKDPPPPPPCTRDEDCPDGFCNPLARTCSPPMKLGSACRRDRECEDELCNIRIFKCAEPARRGDPCARDRECASEWCHKGEYCK